MKIPKSFQLYGQRILVELDPELLAREDARGLAQYSTNKILLQPQTKALNSRASVEQIFCHELLHYLLLYAGYDELRKDELLIERVSHLLHQALTTME